MIFVVDVFCSSSGDNFRRDRGVMMVPIKRKNYMTVTTVIAMMTTVDVSYASDDGCYAIVVDDDDV